MRIAINGFGRIGRCVMRALYECGFRDSVQVVAINGPAKTESHAHLLAFDSIHGRFAHQVRADGDTLWVSRKSAAEHGSLDSPKGEADEIMAFHERDPGKLDWGALGVDLVMECTGAFTTLEDCQRHIDRGAKRVIISAPAKGEGVDTILYGVNHSLLSAKSRVVSIGSCTTNCFAPMALVLDKLLTIRKGFMTTIHAYTGDQNNVDGSHKKDMRRARSCTTSIIPTSTGAATAISKVLPHLKGKVSGTALRVPVSNVSAVDFSFTAGRDTDAKEVNQALHEASDGEMLGVMQYETRPLVSVDFNHSPYSCIVDASETSVVDGNFVRVFSWYDNEWGFSVRMLDVAKLWSSL